VPEDIEEFWEGLRPPRHKGPEGISQEISPELAKRLEGNDALGGALATLQRYSSILQEDSRLRGPLMARDLSDPEVSATLDRLRSYAPAPIARASAALLRDAYTRGQGQGQLPSELQERQTWLDAMADDATRQIGGFTRTLMGNAYDPERLPSDSDLDLGPLSSQLQASTSDLLPGVDYAELEARVLSTMNEMRDRGYRVDGGYIDRLRTILLQPLREDGIEGAALRAEPGAPNPNAEHFAQIERNIQAAIAEMSERGFTIDEARVNQLRLDMLQDFEDATRSAPDVGSESERNLLTTLRQGIANGENPWWTEPVQQPEPGQPAVQTHGPSEALLQRLSQDPAFSAALRQLDERAHLGPAGVRVGDEIMSPTEAARMNYQIGENASWYLSQGIVRTRSSLVREYQENGGLRMDFTPERAEEERLQREAERANLMRNSGPVFGSAGSAILHNAVSAEHRRLAEGSHRQPLQLQDHRMSDTLLRLASLFNELGVQCQVANHLGSDVRTVELEFSLFVDTPECPNSIGGWQSDDGRVHLSLGFPRARR
jgi:hypothetical protein